MVKELTNEIMLFHGSCTEVREIDLSKCEKGKDFGKGFYLTTSYEQAKSFLNQSVKRAKIKRIIPQNWNKGVISCYRFVFDQNLKIKYFLEADKEWLHFVVANRKNDLFPELYSLYKDYDIIGGKIANDMTARTIQLYIGQGYGIPGDENADRIAIDQLLPNRLNNQYCFLTVKSLKCLEFIKGDTYEIR